MMIYSCKVRKSLIETHKKTARVTGGHVFKQLSVNY